MGKTYGIAILGCGHMGEAHMNEIYCLPNIRAVCACDVQPERAKEFQRKYGFARTSADAASCIADPEVDIVIIATYPSTHLEYLRLCIANGKHVLCEKPMSHNPEEAAAFYKEVKEHPEICVLVGYILRHNVSYNHVREMIQNGAIGSPIIMRMSQNHHTMDWPKYLALIKETSPIVDCGVHYLDVMQWFSGEKITWISGVGLRTEADVPEGNYNYGIITVRLSGGSVAYYEAGWSNTMASGGLKEFIGPKGRIRLVYQKDRVTHAEEGDLIEYYRYPEKVYESINLPSDRRPTGPQLQHLIAMIEEGVPANPTIDEVYESFLLAMHADRAIRTAVPETIPENDRSL